MTEQNKDMKLTKEQWISILEAQVQDLTKENSELREESRRDLEDMRKFQAKYIQADQALIALQSRTKKLIEALERTTDCLEHKNDDDFKCSFKGCNCKPQGEIGIAHALAIQALSTWRSA